MIIHMSGWSFGEEASARSRLTTKYKFWNLNQFALLELWLWESTVSLAFNWQAIKRKWTSCHSHTPECTCVHGRAGGTGAFCTYKSPWPHYTRYLSAIFQLLDTHSHMCDAQTIAHTHLRLLLFRHNITNSWGARMCLMLIDQYSEGGEHKVKLIPRYAYTKTHTHIYTQVLTLSYFNYPCRIFAAVSGVTRAAGSDVCNSMVLIRST